MKQEFRNILNFKVGTLIDVCLFWDFLNYLNRPALRAFSAALKPYVHAGTRAHGFSVLSERADVIYKCTDFYTPGDEYGVLWNDPDLNIDWGVEAPLLSEKDLSNPVLKDIPLEVLPVYDASEKPEP